MLKYKTVTFGIQRHLKSSTPAILVGMHKPEKIRTEQKTINDETLIVAVWGGKNNE